MKNNPRLNGSDYLMLGFDYEMRRRGFAGNLCQIVLELGSAISPALLKERANALPAALPIATARLGGLFAPRWKIPRRARPFPRVRVHADEPDLPQKILNEPLETRRGELMRFDLAERKGARMTVIFTWLHPLMDAPAAEYFLAALSDGNLPNGQPSPPRDARMPWRERLELVKKSVLQLDHFCEAQPRSMGVRQPAAPRCLQHRVEKFSAEETARVRANGARLCGVLGDAQFHAAVSALELHALHQRLGCATASYILPVPVGLRPKGKFEPLFSNQVDMLMLQFLPEQLGSVEAAVASLKTQTAQALRERSLSNSRLLSELFSFLPLPIYMALLKHGLHGEICSLFFGDTGAVTPRLEKFLGAAVDDFTHVASVTPAPGLGVIYYYFRGQLRVTVAHAATVLTDAEAAGFAAGLRARLLDP
jgi:hypothetical protein